jgi:hypothetical protein
MNMEFIMGNGKKDKYPDAEWHVWGELIANQLGLKRHGSEYKGPCPNCNGNDRFWIKEYNGNVSVNCRQCGDWKAIQKRLLDMELWPIMEVSDWPSLPSAKNPFKDETPKPYHERKGVPLIGAQELDGNIVVPFYHLTDGKLQKAGSQRISPDGDKKFNKGSKTENAFAVIGGSAEGLTYIAEGWATAVSVHISTNRPCIYALSSGNLPKVAAILQEAKPNATFVIAADNDSAGIDAANKTGMPYRAPRRKGDDWNDVMLRDGRPAVAAELQKVRKKKELFVPLGDLEFKAPEWIIDGLLEKNTFAVCFGAPAAGKTFLTIDMALCIAAQKEFHGHAVDGGPVFYIAGEGHNGFARRAAAWASENDVSLKGLPFFKSSRSIVLTDEEHVQELRSVVDSMVEEHGEPALIVIDTLARAMGAADENSTQQMGAMIRAVDDMRDDYSCTVLAVHHTGHGNKDRARGSSALLGAVDCEFMVEKWGDDQIAKVEVKWTKMKDAMIPEPKNFIHVEKELMGADGNPAKSVALLEIQDSRRSMSKEDRAEDVVKDEYHKIVENFGENWVSRRVLKEAVSIELGVSQRTADRHIKRLVDVQQFLIDNNKLCKGWT